MKIEKRQDPRTLFKIKIDYETDNAYLYDYSRDLSEGGIFIQTEKPLKMGERLSLNFILPEVLEKIEVTAEVTWVNQPGTEGLIPGMGVRFVDLPPEKNKTYTGCNRKDRRRKRLNKHRGVIRHRVWTVGATHESPLRIHFSTPC